MRHRPRHLEPEFVDEVVHPHRRQPRGGCQSILDDPLARIERAPLQWHLVVTIGQKGDPTNDATQPWPDNRPTVELGVITISSVVPDSPTAEKALLFLPTNLTAGIEPSDDPLITLRTEAYAESFGRRSQ